MPRRCQSIATGERADSRCVRRLATVASHESCPSDKGDNGAAGRDGVNGKDGAPGQDGHPGANGAPGLSAYQLWLLGPDGVADTSDENHGRVGDFMKSLHGADGAPGPKGEPGVPNAVATKICTVPMSSGNRRKLGLGTICAGQPDVQTVYIPQS